MFGALARRLFGSANDRYLKSLEPMVAAINEIEPQLETMSDGELRARTEWLKRQLVDGAELDEVLVVGIADDIAARYALDTPGRGQAAGHQEDRASATTLPGSSGWPIKPATWSLTLPKASHLSSHSSAKS